MASDTNGHWAHGCRWWWRWWVYFVLCWLQELPNQWNQH